MAVFTASVYVWRCCEANANRLDMLTPIDRHGLYSEAHLFRKASQSWKSVIKVAVEHGKLMELTSNSESIIQSLRVSK